MAVEQKRQLSSEIAIQNLAINYFENAAMALSYEEGSAIKPLDGEFRRVAEEHLVNKDEYYE